MTARAASKPSASEGSTGPVGCTLPVPSLVPWSSAGNERAAEDDFRCDRRKPVHAAVTAPWHRGIARGGTTVVLFVALIGGWIAPVEGAAQAALPAPSPSASVVDAGDLWWVGGIAAGALLLGPADGAISRAAREAAFQDSPWLSTPAGALRILGFPGPIIATGGLYLVGHITDRPALTDVGLHAGEAVGVAAVFGLLTKAVAGRVRPYGQDARPGDFELGRGWMNDRYQSFPSGHATASFAAAAALTEEVGHHWPHARTRAGVVLFGTASLIAVSRVYHDVHWASDAAAGAALGTLVGGAVVRLAHLHPGNRLDRVFLSADIAPLPDGVAVRVSLVPPL